MYVGKVEWRSRRPGGRAMRRVRGLGWGEGERLEAVTVGVRREDDDEEVAVVEGLVDRNDVMCASSFVYDSTSKVLLCFEESVDVMAERMEENRAAKEKSCRASERIRPRVRSETEGRGSDSKGCRAVESES